MTLACQNDLTLRNATVNTVFYCGFKIWCSNKIKDILTMSIMAKCVSKNIEVEGFFKEICLYNGICILSQLVAWYFFVFYHFQG